MAKDKEKQKIKPREEKSLPPIDEANPNEEKTDYGFSNDGNDLDDDLEHGSVPADTNSAQVMDETFEKTSEVSGKSPALHEMPRKYHKFHSSNS